MFNKVVESFLNIKNDNNSFEFEIRFGSFNQSKYFDCNVDISFFYRLKKMLKIQNNNKNHISSVHIDTYYKSNNDTFRETVTKVPNGQETKSIITKKSIKYHNEFDYDIRFSVASENVIKNSVKLDKKVLIREKNRDTFLFSCGKIDLTKVNEIHPDSNIRKVKFEIEFEVNNKKGTNTVNEICNIIKYILQIRQDNFYIISNYESNIVLNQYKNITKSSFFIGVQPETLQKDNLNLFYNELYSVTQKADGDRCFLFITNTKDIYFVDSNLKITKTNGKSERYSNVIYVVI